MKNRRIGLVGLHDDPQVDLLKRRVEDLGARADIIDFWHFPKFSQARISADTIVYDGLDLTSLDAFYLRQLGYFSPLPQREFTPDEWMAQYGKFNDYMTNEREVLSFRESIIQILCRIRPVVNPYQAAFYHKLKAYQYVKLNSSGLPVPEFVAGNDFFRLREFLDEGESVVKPLTAGYVNHFEVADLEASRPMLRDRPVILQREIKGSMLRSFVLGGSLVGTCQIIHGDDADSRRNIEAMRVFELPDAMEWIPVKACEALGMLFAGVDLLLDHAADKLYVLECNPSPMFRNFEAQTGLPISERLAHYLVEEVSL